MFHGTQFGAVPATAAAHAGRPVAGLVITFNAFATRSAAKKLRLLTVLSVEARCAYTSKVKPSMMTPLSPVTARKELPTNEAIRPPPSTLRRAMYRGGGGGGPRGGPG